MNPKRRIYSIPYNGTNPAWFLQEVEKRKQNIDHVYCELPFNESEMLSHVRFAFDGQNEENVDSAKANLNRANYVRNCLEFLRISYGRVRRICPVNAMYYRFNNFNENRKDCCGEHCQAGDGVPHRRTNPVRLPGGYVGARPAAGTGNPYFLQRVSVEPAANGNLAGKMRCDRLQSAPGNFACAH